MKQCEKITTKTTPDDGVIYCCCCGSCMVINSYPVRQLKDYYLISVHAAHDNIKKLDLSSETIEICNSCLKTSNFYKVIHADRNHPLKNL